MKFTPIFILSVILVLLATLTPGNGKIAGNYLDKVVHFSIFAFMTFQGLKALVDKSKKTELVLWCVLLGLMTEVLQQFIPGRNMEMYDGIADTLGVMSAYYFYKNKV